MSVLFNNGTFKFSSVRISLRVACICISLSSMGIRKDSMNFMSIVPATSEKDCISGIRNVFVERLRNRVSHRSLFLNSKEFGTYDLRKILIPSWVSDVSEKCHEFGVCIILFLNAENTFQCHFANWSQWGGWQIFKLQRDSFSGIPVDFRTDNWTIDNIWKSSFIDF